MNTSTQLISLIVNKELSEVAKMVRDSGDSKDAYMILIKGSVDYYQEQVKQLVALVNIDKYNNGDKVYPREDCLMNFYKDQQYDLCDVSLERQTAGINEGDMKLTELDFYILDQYFYKK
jgi:hypothetical protein